MSRAKFSDEGFKETIQNINSIDMIEDTKQLAQRLKVRIDSVVKAKGGYLLFAKYRTTQDFLAIFLLRETKGAEITRNNNQGLDLNSIQYLDIEHFAMGAKINLTILNNESEDRYISLVRGNTDISHYFESWIGLAETQQEYKDATLLYEIANNIDLPNGM
ncbi:nucleoid-associated protein [Helicobacter himalayensis]|uniref:nucleoid-associated protein n=1 Tax=Helicobacter himalayensis TaxID=1591088 RepID=UPI003D6DEA97